MASKAAEICSPVASSMSISRAEGQGETSRAREIRPSVVFPMAETTTASFSPASTRSLIFLATPRIFSLVATDDPPYF